MIVYIFHSKKVFFCTINSIMFWFKIYIRLSFKILYSDKFQKWLLLYKHIPIFFFCLNWNLALAELCSVESYFGAKCSQSFFAIFCILILYYTIHNFFIPLLLPYIFLYIPCYGGCFFNSISHFLNRNPSCVGNKGTISLIPNNIV